jgi:uncharacterized membrane protein YkvA (DUF1232 family)
MAANPPAAPAAAVLGGRAPIPPKAAERHSCGLLSGLCGSRGCSAEFAKGPFWAFTETDMAFLADFRQRARHTKAEAFALYLAARDARTPWYAKLLLAGIVAYAFSPIDLIPDFVPVLGHLDDLILIPLGIALAIKLVPPSVLAECRERAQRTIQNGKPVGRIAGAVIISIWLFLAALCILWVHRAFMVQS